MNWLLILVMFGALLTIPFGLPGLWIMIGAIGLGAIMGEVGVVIVVVTMLIALVAEGVEFFIVKRLTTQYGGSRRAFWGAIIGGVVGVFVGVPVPVVGSIIAGMVGSFLGAGLVTFAETKELRKAHRVGLGAVIGRALSAVTKAAAGIVILVLGAAAFLR